MNKIKSIIIALLVLVSFSLNAQSFEDLRKLADEAFDEALIEAFSKGDSSAFKEFLEKWKIEEEKEAEKTEEVKKAEEIERVKKAEEAKAYFDRINIMYRSVFFDPIIKGTYTLCFFSLKPVWVCTFVSDNKLWVSILNYDNGKVGKIFYTDMVQSYELQYVKVITGEIVPSIRMKISKGNLEFIQDTDDPYKLNVRVW